MSSGEDSVGVTSPERGGEQRDASSGMMIPSRRTLVTLGLVALVLLCSVAAPVAGASGPSDGPGIGDSSVLLQAGDGGSGGDIPVGISDATGNGGGDSSGSDSDSGIGGENATDSTGSGTSGEDSTESEGGTEEPPEGVTAGEYYDEEQLDAWQQEADSELAIDRDVREMEATAAYELFVEGGEDGSGASVGAGGTAQVGSDIGPSFDPTENAESLAEWFDEWLTNGFIFFVDEVFNDLLGTPYHENDGWMGILGSPIGEQAQALHDYMMDYIYQPVLMMMIIGFIGYAGLVMPVSPLLGKRVMPVLFSMLAFFVVVVFAWNFATGNQMLAHEMTQWFLPSGEELLQIEEGEDGQANFTSDNHELRSGPTAAVLGIKLFGWNIGVVLMLFHSARHVILTLAPAIMPIMIAGMFFGPGPSKAVFSMSFWQYMALTYANIPTALFFGMAFHIDFAFGLGGEVGELANVAMTMFLFSLGLFFPAFLHTMAFGGALAAIITKGSVMSSAKSYAGKFRPAAGEAKRRLAQGGGYINPVSRFKRQTDSSAERDAQRRNVAARYGGGRSASHAGGYYTPRKQSRSTAGSSAGSVSTDGGYATMRSHRGSRSPSLSSDDSPDRGSVDHRRRRRYDNLRKRNRGGD